MYLRTDIKEIQEADAHISVKELNLYRYVDNWLDEIGEILGIPSNLDDMYNCGLFSYYRGFVSVYQSSIINTDPNASAGEKDGKYVLEYIARNRGI